MLEAKQRNMPLARPGLDDGKCRWLGAGDGKAVRLEDAGLFRRDRLQRRAEVLGVIERDVRNHADAEIEDVGGVESPAEANLADQHVDAGAREVVEGRAGEDL